MTGELLNKGIGATRTINDIVLTLSKKKENVALCRRIQECLSTITDILQESLVDMVKLDNMKEQIKVINNTLDEHLKRVEKFDLK